MKKLLTILLGLVLALGGVIGLTACGPKQDKLIVYTEAGFPPFEFVAKGTTEVIGVDIEIAKYIANKYDYELEIIDGSFDTIIAGISEDNALGIAGISWTAARAENIEYSDFYFGGAFQTVVYLKTSNPTLTDGVFDISNFDGKTVVYQTGTTSQLTVAENEAAWKIGGKADYSEVMTGLQEVQNSNGSKYLIVDSQVAAQLCAENTDCAYATIEGVDAESYGVVAKKGNTALIEKVNAAIKELLVEDADGKTQIDKWYDQYAVIEPEE
ncbi:MAG: transporter substrate-binding domain-containing protein [Clostridia bacterium]|nr:transporter substrate-binding domain-containing protein [Clostridia bacterium]